MACERLSDGFFPPTPGRIGRDSAATTEFPGARHLRDDGNLQFLLLVFAGWINCHQQAVIEYLQAENPSLREQLGKKPQPHLRCQEGALNAALVAVEFDQVDEAESLLVAAAPIGESLLLREQDLRSRIAEKLTPAPRTKLLKSIEDSDQGAS